MIDIDFVAGIEQDARFPKYLAAAGLTHVAAQGLDPALRAFLIAHHPPDAYDVAMEKEWPTRIATAQVERDDGGRGERLYR